MTKLLLCVALLAMSFIAASADAATFALPLYNFTFDQDEVDFLSQSCTTSDGKFYYINANLSNTNLTEFLQAWDGDSQSLDDAVDISIAGAQVLAFISEVSPIGSGATVQIALRCLDTSVYVVVGYSNSTDSGVQVFAIQEKAPVTTYSLPLNYTDILLTQESFLAGVCGTTDGKLYYLNADASNSTLLQVWDSTSNTTSNISLLSVALEIVVFAAQTGINSTVLSALTCIGTSPYFTLPYQNSTNSGVELFSIQSSSDSYNIPFDNIPSEEKNYLAQTCSTSDGVFYVADFNYTDGSTSTLRKWDSDSLEVGDSVSLTDVQTQIMTFAHNYTDSVTLLQCIGKNVYASLAYTNDTASGIQLFMLTTNKSAGILSFSYVAFFLALVALVL